MSKEEILTIVSISDTETSYIKELLTDVSIIDVKKFVLGLTRDETFGIIDIINTLQYILKSNVDTVNLFALLSKGYDARKINSVLLEEGINRQSTKIIDETVQLSENIYYAKHFTASDTIVLSDTVLKYMSAQKIETVNFDDVFTKENIYKQLLLDSITVDDSIEMNRILMTSVADEAMIAESIRNAISISPVDVLIISEENVTESEYSRMIADQTGLTELKLPNITYFYVDIIAQTDLVDNLLISKTISLEDILSIVESKNILQKEPLNRYSVLTTRNNRTVLFTK